jgi:hypothetical protein
MTTVAAHETPGPDGETAPLPAGLTGEQAHAIREPEPVHEREPEPADAEPEPAHEPVHEREPEPADAEPEPADDDAGEQAERIPVLALPDLRPYADPKAVLDLARRGASASREPARNAARRAATGAGRLIWRAVIGLVHLVRRIGAGSAIMLGLLVGWLNGTYGTRGSIPARFGGVLVVFGVIAHSVADHPMDGTIVVVWAWCLASLFADRGAFDRLRKKAKGKQAKDAQKGAQKGAQESAEKAPEQDVEKTDARSRKRLAGWLRKRPEPDAEQTPAEDADGTPEQAPAEPSLTALIRELTGDDNGVHLAVLRPAMRKRLPGLSRATDQQLRKVLVDAGYDPSRTFRARGVAGRAGIHRSELPPPPSPGAGPEAGQDDSPPPESGSDLGRSSHSPPSRRAAESARKGRPPLPDGVTAEDVARGYRWVNDAERGPSAWVIERLDVEQYTQSKPTAEQ